jgi:hypothetical protein
MSPRELALIIVGRLVIVVVIERMTEQKDR